MTTFNPTINTSELRVMVIDGTSVNDLYAQIIESKTITFDITTHTKTSLSIDIVSKSGSIFGVYSIPESCKEMKFVEKRGYNTIRRYLKVSRNQGAASLKKYLDAIIHEVLHFDMDLTCNVVFHNDTADLYNEFKTLQS